MKPELKLAPGVIEFGAKHKAFEWIRFGLQEIFALAELVIVVVVACLLVGFVFVKAGWV